MYVPQFLLSLFSSLVEKHIPNMCIILNQRCSSNLYLFLWLIMQSMMCCWLSRVSNDWHWYLKHTIWSFGSLTSIALTLNCCFCIGSVCVINVVDMMCWQFSSCGQFSCIYPCQRTCTGLFTCVLAVLKPSCLSTNGNSCGTCTWNQSYLIICLIKGFHELLFDFFHHLICPCSSVWTLSQKSIVMQCLLQLPYVENITINKFFLFWWMHALWCMHKIDKLAGSISTVRPRMAGQFHYVICDSLEKISVTPEAITWTSIITYCNVHLIYTGYTCLRECVWHAPMKSRSKL